jgi:hypothetical protein
MSKKGPELKNLDIFGMKHLNPERHSPQKVFHFLIIVILKKIPKNYGEVVQHFVKYQNSHNKFKLDSFLK